MIEAISVDDASSAEAPAVHRLAESEQTRSIPRIPIVLGLVVIYALCFVSIKAGLRFAPPLRFAGLRLLIAGFALLALVIVRREPLIPPRRILLPLIALALVANTIGYGAMFMSPGRTGAGVASVLGNTQPLFTVALAAAFLGERMTRGKRIALGFGIAGVTLIAFPALVGPGAYGIAGALLALAVSAGSATGNVIVKRMGTLPSLLATTAWALLIGSVPLLLTSGVAEHGQPVAWTGEFIGLLLFLAVVGTSLTTAVWYWLVQRSDVGRLTMFLFLVPVLGIIMAALLFGERVGLLEIAGVSLTVVGIGVAARDEPEKSGQGATSPHHGA